MKDKIALRQQKTEKNPLLVLRQAIRQVTPKIGVKATCGHRHSILLTLIFSTHCQVTKSTIQNPCVTERVVAI